MADLELFELSLLGGAAERRYRRLRSEVEDLPWGTLDPAAFPDELVLAARKSWTEAAFQEHRTGAACAVALRALMEARAPLDLVALAARFPLDEITHVELCSMLATELGGGAPLLHDPEQLVPKPRPGTRPLFRAADLVVRIFCVGEAISIPLLHGTFRVAAHPLVRGVLGQIVKDEAAHGEFGFMFLDWAADRLTRSDRCVLGEIATETIGALVSGWKRAQPRPDLDSQAAAVHALGWLDTDSYFSLAQTSLKKCVLDRLRERGIPARA